MQISLKTRHLSLGSTWLRDLPGPLRATAKLNGVEPQAWPTDVLERMVTGRAKTHELERLLPWAWQAERLAAAVHA